MSEQINEELTHVLGIQLPESDPREFAKYHRLSAFDMGEVLGINAAVSKFTAIPYPINHGFYGVDIDHLDMLATGVLGWRVPALCVEIAIVKYAGGRTWFGRKKYEFALFVKQELSCYLVIKDVSQNAAVPMLIRALNGLNEKA